MVTLKDKQAHVLISNFGGEPRRETELELGVGKIISVVVIVINNNLYTLCIWHWEIASARETCTLELLPLTIESLL